MDTPVPQVVRGEFVYRDTLLVDVGGEGKRHPRASESELKALLNGKTPKDQVAHWYEAQLIHYGLQRSKEKNIAKVRLQQALNQGKLKVAPPHLLDLEGQMKKEYASAVRKAKSQSKGTPSKVSNEKSVPIAQKRKAEAAESADSKRTKISLNVSDISINIDHGSEQSSKSKKSAKQTPTALNSSSSTAPEASKASRPNGAPPAKSSRQRDSNSNEKPAAPLAKSTSKKNKSTSAPENSSSSPTKQTAKSKADPKTTPKMKVKSEAFVKEESVDKAPAKSKAKATTTLNPKIKSETKSKAKPSLNRDPAVKNEPKVKQETKVKREDDVNYSDGSQHYDEPIHHNITGIYDLSCQQLEEQLPDSKGNLRMLLCQDGDMIWGSFKLAMKSGVIIIENIDIETTISFGWRARDSWESDRLSFGRGCFGDIELYDLNRVHGRFYNLFNEPIDFQGERRKGPLVCGRSVYSFQQE